MDDHNRGRIDRYALLKPNNLGALDIAINALVAKSVDEFKIELRKILDDRTKANLHYYGWVRSQRHSFAEYFRNIIALLGGAALLLTVAAAIARALSLAKVARLSGYPNADVWLIAAAVLTYALMSAALLYERSTEGSGTYFRALATGMKLRDLWNAYQFDDLQRELEPADPDDAKEKQRWIAPARDYCAKLDALAATELDQWKTGFSKTIDDLKTLTDDGLKSGLESVKASAKEAADAAKAAAEAAKAMTAQNAAATINLTLTGTTAGSAKVFIDSKKVAEGKQRSFAVTGLIPGPHVLKVEWTPTVPGADTAIAESAYALTNGINAVSIAIP